MPALTIRILAPRPKNVLPARLLRNRKAVLMASGNENKRVLGVGKVDGLGLFADVARSFRVRYLRFV